MLLSHQIWTIFKRFNSWYSHKDSDNCNNSHIQKTIINKCKAAVTMTNKADGKIWRLNPHIVYWLQITVVRPVIAYCFLWWPKVEKWLPALNLSRYRVACICITRAMSTTPTLAMEALSNLLSGHFFQGRSKDGRLRTSTNRQLETSRKLHTYKYNKQDH